MDSTIFAPAASRLSVVYAQRKAEAIKHLRDNVLPINRAGAKNMFPVLMNKIIVELKGEFKVHTFERKRDKKKITAQVVFFPDGSFGRRPDIQEMLSQPRQ